MDLEYWNTFYSLRKGVNLPSEFAKSLVGKFIHRGDRILELGCGNGRDTIFFASKECPIVGIDQSAVAINEAIQNALDQDFNLFELILKLCKQPFESRPEYRKFMDPPLPHQEIHQTFCGT